MDEYIKKADAVHALCKAVHKNDGAIPCENQTASCLWSKTRVCDYAREIDALPSADVQILSSLLAELTHKERTDRYHVWTTTEVKQWIADKITEMKNDG